MLSFTQGSRWESADGSAYTGEPLGVLLHNSHKIKNGVVSSAYKNENPTNRSLSLWDFLFMRFLR